MREKHNEQGEGERKVRLGQDSLPNIAISVAEMSGNYIHCFTRTLYLNEVQNATGKRSASLGRLVRDKRSSLF